MREFDDVSNPLSSLKKWHKQQRGKNLVTGKSFTSMGNPKEEKGMDMFTPFGANKYAQLHGYGSNTPMISNPNFIQNIQDNLSYAIEDIANGNFFDNLKEYISPKEQLFDTSTIMTPETKAHYVKNGTAGKTTTIDPVSGQVVPISKEQVNPKQQVIANQPAQSNISQEQALQIQQNNALLDTLNNESKINTLLASGAMKGSIDQANMNKWADIQNYNAQGQAMADVRKAMNSKSAGFTPVEYQPIQIPQEFIQAQQLQNQLKTNPIHNINSYGMNIPNNVNNVSTINAPLGGTINGKPVANGANIAGMFDNLGSREERRKKSQATFNSLNF